MTRTDELNITNLMDNVRKVEAAEHKGNEDEISRVRQYCIDAITDYEDTVKKVVKLINDNRDLWKKPPILGSNVGFVDGKPYVLGEHDFYHTHCPFYFKSGRFDIAYGLAVSVGGIYGTKQRTGYCGRFEDHDLNTDGWVAESVSMGDYNIGGGYRPWHNDLISSTFTVREKDGSETRNVKYTPETLKKYVWGAAGWVNLKEMADRTRLRTEAIVREFKKSLMERIEKSTERQNNLTNTSETSIYVRVAF